MIFDPTFIIYNFVIIQKWLIVYFWKCLQLTEVYYFRLILDNYIFKIFGLNLTYVPGCTMKLFTPFLGTYGNNI